MYMRKLKLGMFGLYLFIYVFAVPMLIFDLVPSWGTWMGGFLNMLQGTLLGLWLLANAGGRGVIAAVGIMALSFAVEHVGVTTGVPFGRYTYNTVLGSKVGGAVPLPIPFAWLLVIPGAIATARLMGVRSWRLMLVAPLLVLLFDVLLEPFAVYVLDYWRWIDTGPYYGIPTANFVAWWLTGAVLIGLTLALCGRRITNAHTLPLLPALLYVLNIVQFTLVDLVYGYPLAALIGAGLLAIIVWRGRDEIAAQKQRFGAWLQKFRRGRVHTPAER